MYGIGIRIENLIASLIYVWPGAVYDVGCGEALNSLAACGDARRGCRRARDRNRHFGDGREHSV